jgi:hypothetical protein
MNAIGLALAFTLPSGGGPLPPTPPDSSAILGFAVLGFCILGWGR